MHRKPLEKDPKEMTDAEWKARLSPEEYAVTRKGATERPGVGRFLHNKGKGLYSCVCCGADLFRSDEKFDSGSGWPSYWEAVSRDAVKTIEDRSHGMVRTEARCARCDAHLGHVFDDGPKPTGLRYCINGCALQFEGK